MRYPRPITLRAGLLLCLLPSAFLLLPSVALAQRRLVEIKDIKVGFPTGRSDDAGFKSGAWAPVYVELSTHKDFPPGMALMLEVETADSDNVGNKFTTDVRGLDPEQTVRVMTFVRPGNLGSETVVNLINPVSGQTIHTAKPGRVSRDAMPPDHILYLVAGSRLPQFVRAIYQRERQDMGDDEALLLDTGLRRFGYASNIEHLPTRWFGYQGVDVMILTTSRRDFLEALLGEQTQRKAALAEWVRRGGKLVICAGQNQQLVGKLIAQIEESYKTRLIDCEFKGTINRRTLRLEDWGSQQSRFRAPGIEVAMLAPGKSVDVLVKEKEAPIFGEEGQKVDDVERPLIVQSSCGLGRVVLVAFDIETVPSREWTGQNGFYDRLKQELEPRKNFQQGDGQRDNRGWDEGRSAELAGSLQNNLESFDDIPVVSFGWVALFIFLYILVVGPLDYIFLKKVVKRLELTWITFPVVVIVVSTLAYFTAYYLKGNDLKINKVDVIDIDLHSQRTYGSTWFTLFSPRIQNYTVGVEPNYPAWAQPPAADSSGKDYSPLVGWMGRPTTDWGGSARSGGGGLFKRAYNYTHNDASALQGVPIQVWATKSFSAVWEAPFPSGQPLFTSTLRYAPNGMLTGDITSNLPASLQLQDVVLLHDNVVYSIPRLESGVGWSVEDRAKQGQITPGWINEPLGDPFHLEQRTPRYDRSGYPMAGGDGSLGTLTKRALFFRKYAENQGGMDNATLRYLDQSWRLDRKTRNEAVLFARAVPKPSDGAEAVTKSDGTPTRLWLGEVPGPNKTRDALAGTMLQRTFIRVYIPLTPK